MTYIDTLDAYRKLSRNVREFEIKPIHLKLLRNAEVDWDDAEFGAPSIDPKRPYGNSDVLRDIAELVNPDMKDWEDDDKVEAYVEARTAELVALHVETGVALEICLRRGEFKPGRYRKVSYNKWEPIAPSATLTGGESR